MLNCTSQPHVSPDNNLPSRSDAHIAISPHVGYPKYWRHLDLLHLDRRTKVPQRASDDLEVATPTSSTVTKVDSTAALTVTAVETTLLAKASDDLKVATPTASTVTKVDITAVATAVEATLLARASVGLEDDHRQHSHHNTDWPRRRGDTFGKGQ